MTYKLPKYQQKSFFDNVKVWCTEHKLSVAVVFAGRATCYQDSYEWFKELAERYDVDFYCSLNSDSKPYEEFIKMYNIKKSNFEIYKQPPLSAQNVSGGSNRFSMFYNLKKGVDFISEDEYDIVIYARTDLRYYEKLILAVGGENDIYIPEGSDWGGTNDQLSYGSPRAMKTYASLYDNIHKYSQDIMEGTNPESWMKHHIKNVGLTVHRFDLKYDLNPRRQEPLV
jgi:hypothetical protein